MKCAVARCGYDYIVKACSFLFLQAFVFIYNVIHNFATIVAKYHFAERNITVPLGTISLAPQAQISLSVFVNVKRSIMDAPHKTRAVRIE